MDIVFTLLSQLGLAAVVIMLLVMAELSRRLGVVTRQASFYRLFYLSAVLVAVSFVWRLLVALSPQQFPHGVNELIFYDLPLTVGLIIAVGVGWYYWSWLLSERGKG